MSKSQIQCTDAEKKRQREIIEAVMAECGDSPGHVGAGALSVVLATMFWRDTKTIDGANYIADALVKDIKDHIAWIDQNYGAER